MHRFRASVVAILTLITLGLAAVPVGAVVTPPKVVIIVGPVGTGTQAFRDQADVTYNAAVAAGANAVKVYSPTATWANVKAAVNGANIVVYFGHGNGYPNPYTTVEYTDRVNGWGLNRTTTGGDGDDGYSTMAYCGEKALLGTITSSDGTTQQNYCTPGPITPAPGWVMIYADACYAPGASQSWEPRATEAVALAHVKNYSYPVLKLGASAYYATDMYHGSAVLVDAILRNPSMTYGEITAKGSGYDATAQRHYVHPDLPNDQVWLQRTGSTDPDYRYAFAGNPFATPDGNPGHAFSAAPLVIDRSPAPGAGVPLDATVSATFDMPVTVKPGGFVLTDSTGATVQATVSFDGTANRADLVPAQPLKFATTYTASINGLVVNADLLSVTSTSWTFTTVPNQAPSTYVALTPVRLLDTRIGNGLSGAFSAGVPRTFQVSGRGGVPGNAIAVTGNLTVTGQTRAGFVYLGPDTTASPTSSTLNFPLGDNRANGVTVTLSGSGTLSATYMASAGASTQLVFDVTGYFVP